MVTLVASPCHTGWSAATMLTFIVVFSAAITHPVPSIVADCSAEYSGRLNASLPLAKRVLLIKADSSLLIFSELGSYKVCAAKMPCTGASSGSRLSSSQ